MKVRLFGDGLDALILGYSLSKKEIPFEWVITRDRPGGYFAGGRNCVGNPVDLGMVLLEPNSFNENQIPLSEFDGEGGHSTRPFLDDAYSFLEDLFGQSRLISIEAKAMDGSLYPDYFISDSLDCFLENNQLIQDQLSESVHWLSSNSDWHPRNKRIPDGVISTIGISSYFRRIYGEELYIRFFRGYLESFLGDKINLLPANLHRRAWAPLYWPETLLGCSQRETHQKNLFHPIFTRPNQGSVAKWVDYMTSFVFNSEVGEIKKVQKVDPKDYTYFSSKLDFAFLEDSMATDVDKNSRVLVSDFVELRIIHFCVDSSLDKVIFLNGNKNGCFRYSIESNGPLGIGGITFEFGDSISKTDDETLVQIASRMCDNLGFEARCQGTLFKGKLPLSQPTKSETPLNRAEIGNSFTFHNKSSTSINDNIVRGAAASVQIMRVEI